MKHVVTGGAGFIGSHIAQRLVERGEHVVVIDNLSTGSLANLRDIEGVFDFVAGDIRDPEMLRSVIGEGDIVFHHAARASVAQSVEDPLGTHEHNATGTLVVLKAARDCNAQRVVYAASSSVYGDTAVLPTTESQAPQPLSPYAASKFAGELYCQVFWKVYGLETVVLRYFNVFGPRQDPRAEYAAVIPRFINLVLNGHRPQIFGDGEQSRDFIFVDDVVTANLLAATASTAVGQTINIAGGRAWSLKQVVRLINEALGTAVPPAYGAARPGDIRHSLAAIDKARGVLGFEPCVDFPRGIAATIDWFKQQASEQ